VRPQGGDAAATVAAGWRRDAGTVIVNSSRAVLYASAGEDFAAAACRVALATRDSLRPATAA
jgi:orotidine-5'-phosphate decarboxylase